MRKGEPEEGERDRPGISSQVDLLSHPFSASLTEVRHLATGACEDSVGTKVLGPKRSLNKVL